ncbi:hypothetical protein ACOME3_008273 [Neoechinorhynchus agilis]
MSLMLCNILISIEGAEDGIHMLNELTGKCADQVEHLAKELWHRWNCISWHSLPKWMKDNEYLHRGYRPPLPSVRACLASVFRLHTETINIWTHLVGCLIFTFWFANFLVLPAPVEFKFMVGAFFIGIITCLLCSTVFHIFACHSCRVCKIFNKIDYCGISVLVIGSFIPWLHYAFYCNVAAKIFYLVLLSAFGIICIFISVLDKFGEPECRNLRAAMFVAFGSSAVFPVIHLMIIHGPALSFKYASLGKLIIMGLLYISGAVLYALRVPERFFPGKFDILGQSHQLFHILVVAAAIVHYYAISHVSENYHWFTCLEGRQLNDFTCSKPQG